MHEDLTSYDCIVFIIPVYPHNIYYKIINIIKFKNLVSTPIHLSYYPLIEDDWKRKRDSVQHSYMVIYLSVYLLFALFFYYVIYLHHIPAHYRWDRGRSVLCTYVPCVPCCVLYSLPGSRHLNFTFNIEPSTLNLSFI